MLLVRPALGRAGRKHVQVLAGVVTRAPSRPRQDSNLRTRFRKPMLYPLSYGGSVPLIQS